MVEVSLGCDVLKMPLLLLTFLITLIRFDTKGRYLKVKRKSSYGLIFPKEKSHYF